MSRCPVCSQKVEIVRVLDPEAQAGWGVDVLCACTPEAIHEREYDDNQRDEPESLTLARWQWDADQAEAWAMSHGDIL